jgi:tartrate dehydrogenase/decarboxylase/D-malate dehydrogenase
MFEPVHGSAPDIAGKGVANPIATLWCVQMMLDFLGEQKAADDLMKAIEVVTAIGFLTADLGGTANTTEFTDRVIIQIERQ